MPPAGRTTSLTDWDTGPRMSDEQPTPDEEPAEFRGPGDWKAQADRVEKPNPVWDMPDE